MLSDPRGVTPDVSAATNARDPRAASDARVPAPICRCGPVRGAHLLLLRELIAHDATHPSLTLYIVGAYVQRANVVGGVALFGRIVLACCFNIRRYVPVTSSEKGSYMILRTMGLLYCTRTLQMFWPEGGSVVGEKLREYVAYLYRILIVTISRIPLLIASLENDSFPEHEYKLYPYWHFVPLSKLSSNSSTLPAKKSAPDADA